MTHGAPAATGWVTSGGGALGSRPAGALLDTDELNKDVTFEQRGIMQTMVHPVHRPFKMPGWPVRVDGRPTRVMSSPVLGEHSEQVLGDWLGLSAQAVAALKTDGAL